MQVEIGKKYNKLTVISLSKSKKQNRRNYDCVCECGNYVTVVSSSLINGGTKSCGCHQRQMAKNAKTTHGLSYSAEYNIWVLMIKRCTNINDKRYNRYGGRGITVCKRWLKSFENFYLDMGARPSVNYSIDRIDNNKGYSPKNCRWVTQKQQSRNTSRNLYLVDNGEKIIASDFEKKYKLYRGSVYYLFKSGLSLKQIVDKAKNGLIGKNKCNLNGEKRTIKYWAIKYGICASYFYQKYRELKSVEKCLIFFKKI